MDQKEKDIHHSFVLRAISSAIDWGNRRLTFSAWFVRGDRNIFLQLEIMMLFMVAFCASLMFWIDLIPRPIAVLVAVLLIQRLVEFFIVYSRNFILHQGRVFSFFKDEDMRGQWLLFMFSLNVLQILFIYAVWYRLISLMEPGSFSTPLSVMDSLYFSAITFFTVGYGDILPTTTFTKMMVIGQNFLTFYIAVVVINGVVTMHFRK